jgi:hypothetical protein
MKIATSLFTKLLIFLLVGILAWSCTDTPPVEEDNDTVPKVDSSKLELNTTYKLPSPVELYMFLFQSKARFNKNVLNPVDNTTKYNTTSSRALNFGIYASDVAYCTIFGKNQETFKYFSASKKLADQLGFTEGFDDKIAKRIDQNVSNSDSLLKITNESFSTATNFLQDQGQMELLPLIVGGAWIESLYIAVNSVDKFSPDNEIVIRIADQQFLLENLVEYLKSVGENETNKNFYKQILDLQSSFEQLFDNTDVVITKEQFNEISKKVKSIRSEIISK